MVPVRAKILVPDHVSGLIRSMHPRIKRKVGAAFQALTEDPFAGKALKEELASLRSLQIGRHRVIYRLPQKALIEVITVGSRESVYEETYRLLKGRGEEE